MVNSFVNRLELEEKVFFNTYFWTPDDLEHEKNCRNSHMKVNRSANSKEEICGESRTKVHPFFHRSEKLYWEKAFSEYLKRKTIHDKVADVADSEYLKNKTIYDKTAAVAEVTMDVVYTACNAFNTVAPAIQQVAQAIPIVGISWNLIDAGGAFVLAARDGKKQDNWSKRINILSGVQLAAGTVAFTLINYSNALHIGISTSAGISAIAAGTSGFAFAAAMYFTWALEHREVKLHRARIDYLDKKIKKTEEDLGLQKINEYKNATNEKEKINYIKHFIKEKTGSQVEEYKNLLKLIDFRQHQQERLAIHERARRAWGLCAVFMTVVAIVAVAVIALGLSASTCGIAVAAVSCAALLGSALYRGKPMFDKAAQTIKNGIHSFFKSQAISDYQNDDLTLRSIQVQRPPGPATGGVF